MSDALFETSIRSLPLVYRGKVRDSYAVGDDKLLIVTTDRLSAFDVVMRQPIPGKGKVLNAMSNFWFGLLGPVVPNHLTHIAPEDVVAADEVEQVRGRAVVAMKLKPVPAEAVVRGYMIGSGWKDYRATGGICGIALPPGLQMAQKLPQAKDSTRMAGLPAATWMQWPLARMKVCRKNSRLPFEPDPLSGHVPQGERGPHR